MLDAVTPAPPVLRPSELTLAIPFPGHFETGVSSSISLVLPTTGLQHRRYGMVGFMRSGNLRDAPLAEIANASPVWLLCRRRPQRGERQAR